MSDSAIPQVLASATRFPELVAERVTLRGIEDPDLPRLYALFSDPEAMRWWSHAAWTDMARAQQYLADIRSGFASRTLLQWGVVGTDAPERLIGTVTLFAYMLDRHEWGRGLAREAVGRAIDWAIDDLGLHRIEADADPANARSNGLLERLGFVREGHLRERWWVHGQWADSYYYGLIAGDRIAARS